MTAKYLPGLRSRSEREREFTEALANGLVRWSPEHSRWVATRAGVDGRLLRRPQGDMVTVWNPNDPSDPRFERPAEVLYIGMDRVAVRFTDPKAEMLGALLRDKIRFVDAQHVWR